MKYNGKIFISSFIFTIFFLIMYISQSEAQWYWQKPLPQGNELTQVRFSDTNNGTAVGDAGTILGTTDGGNHWTIQVSGTTSIKLIAVSFVDANNGWAGGTDLINGPGLVLNTTDGGQTWVTKYSSLAAYILGIAAVNVDTCTVVGFDFINGYSIFKTTDGGTTWNPQTDPNLTFHYGISYPDANHGFIVGAGGTILKTTNGGTDWVDISGSSGTTGDLLGVSFFDSNHGIAIGSENSLGLILNTTDGGTTWNKYIDNTTLGYQSVSYPASNVATVVGSLGNILRTTDGGTTWTPQTSGTPNLLEGVSFTDANNGTVVGIAGELIRTTNGGNNWFFHSSGTTLSSNLGVSFTGENNGTAVGYDGSILRTTDKGATWVQQISNSTSELNDVCFLDSLNGFVCGYDGTILRTTDAGENWVLTESHAFTYYGGIVFSDALHGVAVGQGPEANSLIKRTTDGGDTWVLEPSSSTQRLNEISFGDANNAWAVGDQGTIIHSTDGGSNWTNQTSGTTVTLNDVCFIDANTGYVVGLSNKILKTTNGGANWIDLPNSAVNGFLAVSFSDVNNGIAVGGYGFVFRTTDGGGTWVSEPSGVAGDLNAVDMINASTTTVVGVNGAILKEGGAPTTFQLSVDISNGWNMVSVPGINPDGQGVTTWWPGLTGTVYKFIPGSGYSGVTTTTPGEGYWMKNVGDNTYNTGDEWPASGIEIVPHDPLSATGGWNMFGGYENSVDVTTLTTTPPDQILFPIYKYLPGTGYQTAATLDPGYGYWVKVSSDCQINISNTLSKGSNEVADNIKEEWGKIILSDASGSSCTLYAVNGEPNLTQYELPPLPPAGSFDIRYGSGKYAENLSQGNQTIDMQGVEYPVTVRTVGINIKIQDVSGKLLKTEINNGQKITINNSSVTKLVILSEDIATPIKYSLEQNYPNPFNPSTTIKFSIPEAAKVTLNIYNVLGQKVTELVNQRLEAGKYGYQWDAGKLASGLYLYELRTEKYISIKKMLLLK